ncbi:hypothetical protein [Liquorilactobacillus nagelii]|jgi:hypothetical protein|uniref:hypothetical protein n=1 Tax=Liquorilactobacillus nagelii TaxID=82688 RepID=UPI0006F0C360|nr:hypothetical protein [Liquorilactobacillus nagelii]KRL39910.1 hypothetical protein FD45_GL000086 [Liquorilactobacillus nagelii DSM 13675]QYH53427.1 hypothetical protein G6O73_01435 [Liquorilactobacillus nagelii DSM 13675]
MKKIKINVLGIEYTAHLGALEENEPRLSDFDGFTDTSTKDIYIAKFEYDNHSIKDLKKHSHQVLRHEIVHAFLFESGLDCNSDWARNEEIVDWIALQFPKINKVFESLNIKE